MEIILLTRPGNLQAIKTIEECHRRGVRIASAVIEPKTWAEKVRRIRRFYRANGLADTLRKGWDIFGQARIGCLNAHTGWLPQYRGVHANFWALLEGGKTGVTVHYVDAGVDTGSIVLRKELAIVLGDTIESIELRTVDLCASLMTDAIVAIEAGTLAPLPQTADQGRQYRALSFRKEEEVRRLLRELSVQNQPEGMAHGGA